jgi:hypothetical protein
MRLAAVLSLVFVACFPTEDPQQRLSGPYILLNAFSGGSTYLAYEFDGGSTIGRVSWVVVAAGADENHVIVKRHPEGDTSVTEYYIIDRRRDGPYVDPSVCVVGPLDRDQFVAERVAMGVSPALDFSVVF